MAAMPVPGRFLVLDGVDGCGKSTQAERLVQALGERTGREVVHLREPGSTPLGEGLRALLLARDPELAGPHAPRPAAEALLFTAARRQMLEERVAPALARGAHVVCERFHASTFAYQAVAGDVDEERLLALLSTWAGTPRPDLVVLLALEPAVAAARRGASRDRIEDRGPAFQEAVAGGFRRYAERVEGVVVVDAHGTPEVVGVRVLTEVERVL